MTLFQPYTPLNTSLVGQQTALQLATSPASYIPTMTGLPTGVTGVTGPIPTSPAINGLTSAAIVTSNTGQSSYILKASAHSISENPCKVVLCAHAFKVSSFCLYRIDKDICIVYVNLELELRG